MTCIDLRLIWKLCVKIREALQAGKERLKVKSKTGINLQQLTENDLFVEEKICLKCGF